MRPEEAVATVLPVRGDFRGGLKCGRCFVLSSCCLTDACMPACHHLSRSFLAAELIELGLQIYGSAA